MLVPCCQNASEGNQIAFSHNCGAILQRFLCLRNRKIVIDPLLTQNPKKQAGLDGNNGNPAERTVVKSTNRSRNDSDLPLRQPTDQKAGGSNPSRRTKSPRNRLISRTFAFRKLLFSDAAFF